MPDKRRRTKSITDLKGRVVNHEELHALVNHISTVIAAQDVRIEALEQALALGVVVDQEVAAAAREFVQTRNAPGAAVRVLSLVDEERTDELWSGLAAKAIADAEPA